MATIAMMLGGAVLNATAFVGGSYLAKYLSGGGASDTEKIRHDKALEKYQKDYSEYQEKRQKLIDWKIKKKDEKYQASKNLSKTDEALELYSETHEPKFSDYYRPSDQSKNWVKCYMLEVECWHWVIWLVNYFKL